MEKNKKDWLVVCGLIGFNGISIIGSVISEVAIPWLILQMTGSPAYVGMLIGLKFFPVLLSMLLGDALIDHYGKYKISQYSDVLNFFAVAMIPLFFMFDMLDITWLLLFILLSALLDGPGRSAKDVLLATEINRRKMVHEKVNGINAFVENIADLAGPLLAGVLISAIGVANVLWVDAATFLVPVIGLMLLRKMLSDGNKPREVEIKFSFKNSFSGFSIIRQHQSLGWVLMLSTMVNTIVSTLVFVFLPIFVSQIYGDATSLGLILSGFAGGTIAASVVYSVWGKGFSFRIAIILANVLMAGSFISLNYLSGLVYFTLNMAILGFAVGVTGPLEATYLQTNIAEHQQGRVFSTFYAARMLLVPGAMMITGFYLQGLGTLSVSNMPNVLLLFGMIALIGVWIFMRKTKGADL